MQIKITVNFKSLLNKPKSNQLFYFYFFNESMCNHMINHSLVKILDFFKVKVTPELVVHLKSAIIQRSLVSATLEKSTFLASNSEKKKNCQ